jgi:hypothetical protein
MTATDTANRARLRRTRAVLAAIDDPTFEWADVATIQPGDTFCTLGGMVREAEAPINVYPALGMVSIAVKGWSWDADFIADRQTLVKRAEPRTSEEPGSGWIGA